MPLQVWCTGYVAPRAGDYENAVTLGALFYNALVTYQIRLPYLIHVR